MHIGGECSTPAVFYGSQCAFGVQAQQQFVFTCRDLLLASYCFVLRLWLRKAKYSRFMQNFQHILTTPSRHCACAIHSEKAHFCLDFDYMRPEFAPAPSSCCQECICIGIPQPMNFTVMQNWSM